MRRIISKLLVLSLILNTISVFSVLASAEYIVYNCGELVELEHGVKTYNSNLYICKNDVWQLDLDYDSNYIRKENQSLYLKEGSNVIQWSGGTMMYPQACVKIDGLTYVQLNLIAMVFSRIYDIDDRTINLWIEYRNYSTKLIMGTVSSGQAAPQGGTEVEICAVKPIESELNIFDYYINEYPSYEELSTGLVEDGSYTITASTKIKIPEGENCADYYLTTNRTFLENQIFCKVNGEMSCQSNVHGFYRGNSSYNFYFNEYGHMYGKIIVDKAAEEDTNFIVVSGRGYNSYIGRKKIVTLPKGETEVSYSIEYYQYYRPQIYVVSDSGKYERKFINSIKSYYDNFEYNIYLNGTESTTVKLLLPNGEVASEDMSVKVYLKSNVNDSIISSQIVTIPEGENNIEIELANDTSGIYYCEYELLDDYEGYYKRGYYGRTGTAVDKDYAEGISEHDTLIEVPLIKTKTVSVRVTLPNGEIAKNDIYGWLYERETLSQKRIELFAVNSQLETAVSGGNAGGGGVIGTVDGAATPISVSGSIGQSSSSSKTPSFVIKQGESYAEVPLKLLCDTDNIIELDIEDNSNRYYRKMYYTEDGGSVLKSNATTPDGDELSFILIKQNKISGFINDKISKFCTALYAIFQDDVNVMKDIYQTEFFETVYIYDENRYSLYVPNELKNYTLSLDNEYYYTKNSALENKKDAEILTVNDDIDDIDLIYPENKYESQLPIRAELYGNNGEYKLRFISENSYPINCFIKLGLYDNEGRLIDLLESEYECYKDVYYTYKLTIPSDKLNRVTKVKSFIWDKNMIPLSNSCEIQISQSPTGISLSSNKYCDVDDASSYAEAIYALSALDIAHGYEEEDGQLLFRPYLGVTRAMATVMITAALNMTEDAQATEGLSKIPDANNTWFSGCVNVGVAQGFVDVYDDGLFHPHDNITYAQLCKMLTIILGYGDYAEAYGGYPTGYTTMASAAGINKGVAVSNDTHLNRGQVCQMIYNAITTPVLAVIEYRLDGNIYGKLDGKDGKVYNTILSDKFDAYVIKGTVDSFPKAGTVRLTNITSDYAKAYDAYSYFDTATAPYIINEAIIENDIDLSNSIGQQINAMLYVDTNNKKHLVFATSQNVVEDTKKYAILVKVSDQTDILLILPDGTRKYYEAKNDSIYTENGGVNVLETPNIAVEGVTAISDSQTVLDCVVEYTVKNGQINYIKHVSGMTFNGPYKESVAKIGAVGISSETGVINTDGAISYKDYKKMNASEFINEETYIGAGFGKVTGSNKYAFIILTKVGYDFNANSRFAVVNAKAFSKGLDADGDEVDQLKVLVNGEKTTLDFTTDAKTAFGTPSIGDAFFYTVNSDGLVDSTTIIPMASITTSGKISLVDLFGADNYDADKWGNALNGYEDIKLVKGLVVKVGTNSVGLLTTPANTDAPVDFDAFETFSFADDCTIYTYDTDVEVADKNKLDEEGVLIAMKYKDWTITEAPDGTNATYTEADIGKIAWGFTPSAVADLRARGIKATKFDTLEGTTAADNAQYALALIVDDTVVQIYEILAD